MRAHTATWRIRNRRSCAATSTCRRTTRCAQVSWKLSSAARPSSSTPGSGSTPARRIRQLSACKSASKAKRPIAATTSSSARLWRRGCAPFRSTATTGPPTTSRSSSRLNEGAQLLDPLAIDAEVAPPQARGRAHVHEAGALVVVELHVVDVAHERRAEFGVQIVRLGADKGRARHRFDRRAQLAHGAAKRDRRDVVLAVLRLGLRGDAVRRGPAWREPLVLHPEVRRPPPIEHRRGCYHRRITQKGGSAPCISQPNNSLNCCSA